MKKLQALFLFSILLTGCARSRYDVWEDTKTASRHMSRGLRHIAGAQTESRQVRNRNDFMYEEEMESYPLCDLSHNTPSYSYEEREIPMARELPGEEGSNIPGIDAFFSPSSRRDTSSIFCNINFPYNSSLIKGRENLITVRNISEYLIQHPNTYIFVEGHCDERGPQAFNLALGSRRSNAVRNLLIKEGVNPNQIFTISYGKERPLEIAHTEEAWTKNRRGEFKLYQKGKS